MNDPIFDHKRICDDQGIEYKVQDKLSEQEAMSVNIVLIHYHLKTGGVTSVIKDQIMALQGKGCDFMVLAGSLPKGPFPAPIIRIPELAYDRDVTGSPEPQTIANDILTAIHRHWARGADIIHVHNPTLTKNRYLQPVLHKLQQDGQRILCQIHDFAEDGRPNVYLEDPYIGNCHYIAINPRDWKLLLKAGLSPKGCHLLPNAVSTFHTRICRDGEAETVLYPVRAIRRKNIGEAILLSLFFKAAQHLAITLPPNSPNDIESYNQWRDFVEYHHLNIDFEAGLANSYQDLLNGCRYVLTTSITEGYGFSFLEAWTAGKAIWGRALPDICQGFTRMGVQLDHLYRQLKVPLEWLDEQCLSHDWTSALKAAARQFGFVLSPAEIAAAWKTVSADRLIDFGLLAETYQRAVIHHLLLHYRDRTRLIRINPFLAQPGPPEASAQLIAHNKTAIEKHFNHQRYARDLRVVYNRVVKTPIRHQIHKQTISVEFLKPKYFSMLKWGH